METANDYMVVPNLLLKLEENLEVQDLLTLIYKKIEDIRDGNYKYKECNTEFNYKLLTKAHIMRIAYFKLTVKELFVVMKRKIDET